LHRPIAVELLKLKLEMSKEEKSKKMSDTVNDNAKSIGPSAIVEASHDLKITKVLRVFATTAIN
jgi:hypothetical protein